MLALAPVPDRLPIGSSVLMSVSFCARVSFYASAVPARTEETLIVDRRGELLRQASTPGASGHKSALDARAHDIGGVGSRHAERMDDRQNGIDVVLSHMRRASPDR
jgi:hypothetical protein